MLNKKKKNLQHKSTEVWNEYYKSQQKDAKPEASKGDTKKNEGKKDDNVVDADFEEVKEDNKEKSA